MEKAIARIKSMDEEDVRRVLKIVAVVAAIAFVIFGIPGIVYAFCPTETECTISNDMPENATVTGTAEYTVVERVVDTSDNTLRIFAEDARGNVKTFSVPYDSDLQVGSTVTETTYEVPTNYWEPVVMLLTAVVGLAAVGAFFCLCIALA